jgi:Spy/CpxP family protein refolding chaperone
MADAVRSWLGALTLAMAVPAAAPAGSPGRPPDGLCDSAAQSGAHEQGSSKPTLSHKWWSSEEGRAAFGISEEQSRGLEAIFQSMLPALKAAKADIDQHKKALSRLLSEARASEAEVVQAIDRLEAANSSLSRTRTLMLYRMYRLLTPEQRAKVQAHYDQRASDSESRPVRR